MSATPRPWMMDKDSADDNDILITSESRIIGNYIDIAKICTGDSGKIGREQDANAALIITAVNAHDHMIAALDAVLTFSNDPHVIEIAKKALAVAGAR